MPSPAEDVTTTPPEEAHEEMSPSAQLVFGNGNGGGGGGSECVLSPVSAVSGGAWGAPRDPPAVDGRSPGGSETAEVDMMDFLQEVGQQRLREEAREEVGWRSSCDCCCISFCFSRAIRSRYCSGLTDGMTPFLERISWGKVFWRVLIWGPVRWELPGR